MLTGPIRRYAVMMEFLLAAIAAQVIWAEVGGAGHLDLIPWYLKLGLILALAWTTARATVAAVEGERCWNLRVAKWSLAAVLVMGGMAGATYYAHLHEEDDSGGGDPAPVAASGIQSPQRGGTVR
jgi:hypothetical protein